MRKAVLYACLAAFGAYVAAGAVLWAGQTRLIFEPMRSLVVKPAELAFPVAEVMIPVRTASAEAQMLHAWWMPVARADAKVILYFHGNDGNVSTSIGATALLRELGYAVLVVDYRGYGESDGVFPKEATIYEDAEAALAALVDRWLVKPRDVYVYGHSLGAAVAIDLAAKHPELGGLIVESGFTSIYDMARLESKYEIYPVSLLLNQRFESIKKVSQLALPVLYIHGTADRVVPYSMGVALFEQSGGFKRFVAVPGGGHENNAAVAPAALRAAITELTQAERPVELADFTPAP
jgi:pimeloyl-ACP methyl ester carboxylesterase